MVFTTEKAAGKRGERRSQTQEMEKCLKRITYYLVISPLQAKALSKTD